MSDASKGRVLLLGSEGMGRGDDQLGRTILENFLKILVGNPLRPERIVCWNGGVKLLTPDSPVVGLLKDLQGVGVEILACKTCVNFFGLEGRVQVGEVVTMAVISELVLRGEVLTV